MIKNPKDPKKEVLAKTLFRPNYLMVLAVILMLFTLFRVLYYL